MQLHKRVRLGIIGMPIFMRFPRQDLNVYIPLIPERYEVISFLLTTDTAGDDVFVGRMLERSVEMGRVLTFNVWPETHIYQANVDQVAGSSITDNFCTSFIWLAVTYYSF